MFERVKRFFQKVAEERRIDDEVDRPTPQRSNPNPGKDNWYARVADKSLSAAAKRETAALERADGKAPVLKADAAREVDDLFARVEARTKPKP